MTQEDKKMLLLKELSSRLPYGVKVRISSESDGCLHEDTTTLDIDNLHKFMLNGGYYKRGLFYKTPGFQLLPYLRPLSSMTEEEKREIYNWLVENDVDWFDFNKLRLDEILISFDSSWLLVNWLLKNHFDFMGLIPMGLALEAPKDMYKNRISYD